MAKVQSFLLFDCTTVANYKSWAQGIGSALSTLGWSKTADAGQVNWANVTSVSNGTNGATVPIPISSYALSAWAAGTAYAAGSATSSNVVTNAGLTYICQSPTQYTALTNVVLGANSSTLATAITVSGTSVTYTASVSGATTNSLVGQIFTASGGSIANNNVTYAICTSNTTTSVVLQFSGAAAQSTGTLPTLTTSNANFSVGYGAGSTQAANWIANALAGMSVVTAGFTGNTNANGTFTVLASSYDSSINAYVGMAYSSAPTTGSGYSATLTMNTAPASDLYVTSTGLGHWFPYNYEVWQSNDSLSGTSPLFIRLLYQSGDFSDPTIYIQVGTASSGNGYLTGNCLNSGLEIPWIYVHNPAQGSVKTFECDFSQYEGSFAMALWRGEEPTSAPILILDRSKDVYGNDTNTYTQVLVATDESAGAGVAYSQVLYRPGGGAGVAPPIWSSGAAWPTISTSNFTSLSLAGLTPALPIFPNLGLVANPCLQAMVMLQGDCANGQLINAVLYGAEHTYLMWYVYPALSGSVSNVNAVGLRWD